MVTGLFFGSFNPIHVGHLVIAAGMLAEGGCQQVWFVVSPQNPFKDESTLLHPFDRYELVKLAIEGDDRLSVTDIEFHLPKPSFTVNTLEVLRERFPKRHFKLIMGGDNVSSFHKWKDYEQIIAKHELLVYSRPGQKLSPLEPHEHIHRLELPMLELSASLIRQWVKAGKSIRHLVPDPVADEIARKKFYL